MSPVGSAEGAGPGPVFSVVIPTWNRLEALPEVLAALEDQAWAPPFEVIVVDDGSEDGTWEWLSGRSFRCPIRAERQPNRGPAAARNRGVALAGGQRVAFLGDDTVPGADWLYLHERAWRRREDDRPIAVLGYTRWHRRLPRTRFMEYINEHGPQFGYRLIRDPEEVAFQLFYTSNLSVDRELLLEEPFHEGFPAAAWEDAELGYRLQERFDLRIVYEPRAVVEHDHPSDPARFRRRQRAVGASAPVMYRLHPELGPMLKVGPGGPAPLSWAPARWLRGALVRALQYLPLWTPRLWQRTLDDGYLEGLWRSWREEPMVPEGELR